MDSSLMLSREALRRRRLMLALAAVPLGACVTRPALVNPVAPPAELPPAPRVRIGDRWRYIEINAYNGERIAEVAHEAVDVGERIRMRLIDSRGRPRADEIYTRAWSVLTEATFDFP